MSCSYYKSQGFSMEPFLLDGDELIVDTSSEVAYHVGDIVLYRSPRHPNAIAHRLVFLDEARRSVVLRSDAEPQMVESLGIEAIVGKVEHVRRGERLVCVNGTITTRLFNQAIALWRPSVLRFKHRLASGLMPIVMRLQRTSMYRQCAVRLVRATLHLVQPQEEGGAKIVAMVRGRYAGSLDIEPRRLDHGSIGWISSLSVRARYRGAGIASRMVQRAETVAGEQGLGELWVEHAPGNVAGERLYQKLGFQVAAPTGGKCRTDTRFRRKTVLAIAPR